jgi:hypothetical protein
MTALPPGCRLEHVTPQLSPAVHDPERAELLEAARVAAQTAHEIAIPPLVSALGYLASLADNSLLPEEICQRARQATLRVVEAAVHLECLPDVFNAEDQTEQDSVRSAGVNPEPTESVGNRLRARWVQAVEDLGRVAAAEEAAEVLKVTLPSGFSLQGGRVHVSRAWRVGEDRF